MADYTPVRAYLGMPNIGRPKATQAAAWDVMKA